MQCFLEFVQKSVVIYPKDGIIVNRIKKSIVGFCYDKKEEIYGGVLNGITISVQLKKAFCLIENQNLLNWRCDNNVDRSNLLANKRFLFGKR